MGYVFFSPWQCVTTAALAIKHRGPQSFFTATKHTFTLSDKGENGKHCVVSKLSGKVVKEDSSKELEISGNRALSISPTGISRPTI